MTARCTVLIVAFPAVFSVGVANEPRAVAADATAAYRAASVPIAPDVTDLTLGAMNARGEVPVVRDRGIGGNSDLALFTFSGKLLRVISRHPAIAKGGFDNSVLITDSGLLTGSFEARLSSDGQLFRTVFRAPSRTNRIADAHLLAPMRRPRGSVVPLTDPEVVTATLKKGQSFEYAIPSGINERGQIIATAKSSLVVDLNRSDGRGGGLIHWTQAFRTTEQGKLTDPDANLGVYPGFLSSEALGINAKGDVVGVLKQPDTHQQHAFVLAAGGRLDRKHDVRLLTTPLPAREGETVTIEAQRISDREEVAGTIYRNSFRTVEFRGSQTVHVVGTCSVFKTLPGGDVTDPETLIVSVPGKRLILEDMNRAGNLLIREEESASIGGKDRFLGLYLHDGSLKKIYVLDGKAEDQRWQHFYKSPCFLASDKSIVIQSKLKKPFWKRPGTAAYLKYAYGHRGHILRPANR